MNHDKNCELEIAPDFISTAHCTCSLSSTPPPTPLSEAKGTDCHCEGEMKGITVLADETIHHSPEKCEVAKKPPETTMTTATAISQPPDSKGMEETTLGSLYGCELTIKTTDEFTIQCAKKFLKEMIDLSINPKLLSAFPYMNEFNSIKILSARQEEREEMIKEILIPCDLIKDLEDQIVNQLLDLLARAREEGRQEERSDWSSIPDELKVRAKTQQAFNDGVKQGEQNKIKQVRSRLIEKARKEAYEQGRKDGANIALAIKDGSCDQKIILERAKLREMAEKMVAIIEKIEDPYPVHNPKEDIIAVAKEYGVEIN